MAHTVCPYDGFAPAPILTNRLLLRARRSGDFLPSRPFEFRRRTPRRFGQAPTRATSREVRARVRDWPICSPRRFLRHRGPFEGTRDHRRLRRLRHNPSLIVVERHRSRLSRGGSPGARERAPRRGGGRRALGPPRDGLALILANKTARARAPVALARARSVGSIRPFALFSSPAAYSETPPSPVVTLCRSGLEKNVYPLLTPFLGWFRTVLPSFLPQKAPPPPVSVLRRRACTGAGARGFRSGSP